MADAAYCDEECSRLQWQMQLTALKMKKKGILNRTVLRNLRHQRDPRALNPPDRTGLRNLC